MVRLTEDLEKGDARFMASVVCVDTMVAASVQSQQDYDMADVRFGERFVEIYTEDAKGVWWWITVACTRPSPSEDITLMR